MWAGQAVLVTPSLGPRGLSASWVAHPYLAHSSTQQDHGRGLCPGQHTRLVRHPRVAGPARRTCRLVRSTHTLPHSQSSYQVVTNSAAALQPRAGGSEQMLGLIQASLHHAAALTRVVRTLNALGDSSIQTLMVLSREPVTTPTSHDSTARTCTHAAWRGAGAHRVTKWSRCYRRRQRSGSLPQAQVKPQGSVGLADQETARSRSGCGDQTIQSEVLCPASRAAKWFCVHPSCEPASRWWSATHSRPPRAPPARIAARTSPPLGRRRRPSALLEQRSWQRGLPNGCRGWIQAEQGCGRRCSASRAGLPLREQLTSDASSRGATAQHGPCRVLHFA